MTKEEYKIMSTHTKSFYEKLLLLKDKMNESANKLQKRKTPLYGGVLVPVLCRMEERRRF
jgi:hypothetical protein